MPSKPPPPSDPRSLKPIELCRLLNSTPLGKVLSEQDLRNQRNDAGMRIGTQKTVDLIRYVGWLVQNRHAPKPPQAPAAAVLDLAALAQGAALIASAKLTDPGAALNGKQIRAIAALISEPTHQDAAAATGVTPVTISRWLRLPHFRAALYDARRELMDHSTGRIQALTGQAVDTLKHIVQTGRRDSDRIRAAQALLNYGHQGLAAADQMHARSNDARNTTLGTTDIVAFLAERLRQVESANLGTPEKTRLAATISKALLQAIEVDIIEKRLVDMEHTLNRLDSQRAEA